MSKHGGKREGAGRKAKDEEIKLVEKLKEKIDINSSEGLNISFKDLIRFK